VLNKVIHCRYGRSCNLHGHVFVHAWMHPRSYQPVIPLQT